MRAELKAAWKLRATITIRNTLKAASPPPTPQSSSAMTVGVTATADIAATSTGRLPTLSERKPQSGAVSMPSSAPPPRIIPVSVSTSPMPRPTEGKVA